MDPDRVRIRSGARNIALFYRILATSLRQREYSVAPPSAAP
jgi:hypothetical protein